MQLCTKSIKLTGIWKESVIFSVILDERSSLSSFSLSFRTNRFERGVHTNKTLILDYSFLSEKSEVKCKNERKFLAILDEQNTTVPVSEMKFFCNVSLKSEQLIIYEVFN